MRDEVRVLLHETEQSEKFLRGSGFELVARLLSDESSESLAGVKLTSFADNSILHYDWSSSQRLILSRGGRRRDIVLMKNID